jgi:hypothetical protein
MSSIRWIRNVLIDGQASTIEIMLGAIKVGDRCYARINAEGEIWFTSMSESRSEIVSQGKELLQQALAGKSVQNPDGSDFNWAA